GQEIGGKLVKVKGWANVGGITPERILRKLGKHSALKTVEQVTQALYRANFYFSLHPRSPEFRAVNQNIPLMRRILPGFAANPGAEESIQMNLDAFYVTLNGKEITPTVTYMNKSMWKRY